MKNSLSRFSASTTFLLALLFSSFANNVFALDINTASVEELQTLKGVGQKRAEAIVRYRAANGPFQTIEDLQKAPGIGESTLKANRDQLEINSPSAD
jgi:competence protein ComEA